MAVYYWVDVTICFIHFVFVFYMHFNAEITWRCSEEVRFLDCNYVILECICIEREYVCVCSPLKIQF